MLIDRVVNAKFIVKRAILEDGIANDPHDIMPRMESIVVSMEPNTLVLLTCNM